MKWFLFLRELLRQWTVGWQKWECGDWGFGEEQGRWADQQGKGSTGSRGFRGFWLQQLRGWRLPLPTFRKLEEKYDSEGRMKRLWDFQVEIRGVWGWKERWEAARINLGVVNTDLAVEAEEGGVRRAGEQRAAGAKLWGHVTDRKGLAGRGVDSEKAGREMARKTDEGPSTG